jgi:mono/diheme cytochrome c family protein
MKTEFAQFRLTRIVILTLVAPLALGVSFALARRETRTNETVYSALAKAPRKAQAKRNPFQNDPEARLAGKNLFREYCAECHGHTAEGGKRGPSLRALEVQQAAPGAIFWILSNGVVRRGMPDWSKLPEPERWQIVTFLKSLTASAATQPLTDQR